MEMASTTVVLLVEDDPGDQKLIKYALKHQPVNSELKIAGTGEERNQGLACFPFALQVGRYED